MKKIWMLGLCLVLLCGCRWGGTPTPTNQPAEPIPTATESQIINENTYSGTVTEITDVSIFVQTGDEVREYILNENANKVIKRYKITVGSKVVVEFHKGENGIYEIDRLGVSVY